MMSWVKNPEPDAAKRRLVDVLHDEIRESSQIQLHLPFPRDPALKRMATRFAKGSKAARDLAALARGWPFGALAVPELPKGNRAKRRSVAQADAGAALSRTAGRRTIGDRDLS